jgi:hypothetical protein
MATTEPFQGPNLSLSRRAKYQVPTVCLTLYERARHHVQVSCMRLKNVPPLCKRCVDQFTHLDITAGSGADVG